MKNRCGFYLSPSGDRIIEVSFGVGTFYEIVSLSNGFIDVMFDICRSDFDFMFGDWIKLT